jgi:hypothetical protein
MNNILLQPRRIIRRFLRYVTIYFNYKANRRDLRVSESLFGNRLNQKSPPRLNLTDDEDLFIVTSCTNPHDLECAFNHNRAHLESTRATELLESFSSIRKYYPTALIFNLENSSISNQIKVKVESGCDQHYDYSGDEFIKSSRASSNKAVPWLAKIIKFLHEEGHRIKSRRVHFLAGRYTLDAPFTCQSRDVGVIFRYYESNDSVSTRYFFFNNVSVKTMKSAFTKSLSAAMAGYSVEEFIHLTCSCQIRYLARIGVRGLVNGEILIEE